MKSKMNIKKQEAGINPREAETIGIAVDYRRVNKSVFDKME